MWIFCKLGFFSVVQDRADRRRMQIRGRLRQDVEAMAGLVEELTGRRPEVLETPAADYRFRIVVSPTVWRKIGARIVAEIDYPNFKGEVLRPYGDQERSEAYHQVWATMHRLQVRTRARASG
jgi:hypothetical protein